MGIVRVSWLKEVSYFQGISTYAHVLNSMSLGNSLDYYTVKKPLRYLYSRRPKRSLYSKDDTSGPVSDTGQAGQGSEASQEEKNKSRIDDLWASFKMETAQPKKSQPPPPPAGGAGEVAAAATKTQSTQGKVQL